MKTKLILLTMSAAFILNACSFPKYLPRYDTIGENQYGSFIKIKRPNKTALKGELIAVQLDGIYILSDSVAKGDTLKYKQLHRVTLEQMENFSVYFAKPPSYEIFVPLLSLATISHGAFLIFSFPINLITTIAVASGAYDSSSYNSKEITMDQLKMYARYPQGIPPGIDIASIR